MKKGRLSQSDKYIIQGMINDKKSISDISDEVHRSEKCVQNYIDNELDQIIEHVVQGKIGRDHIQEQKKVEPGSFQKGMIRKTLDRKRDGISVMTQAASEISEKQSVKEKNHASRSTRNAIFNIKENRMENEE